MNFTYISGCQLTIAVNFPGSFPLSNGSAHQYKRCHNPGLLIPETDQ